MVRQCGRCGSKGPFYASQPGSAVCIACWAKRRAAAYARTRLASGLPLRTRQREAYQAILDRQTRERVPDTRPFGELSRRDQFAVLQARCPPRKLVCLWCWGRLHPARFAINPSRPRGYDYTCKACRRILDRLRKYA
jgi:hypothetical protein